MLKKKNYRSIKMALELLITILKVLYWLDKVGWLEPILLTLWLLL